MFSRPRESNQPTRYEKIDEELLDYKIPRVRIPMSPGAAYLARLIES